MSSAFLSDNFYNRLGVNGEGVAGVLWTAISGYHGANS